MIETSKPLEVDPADPFKNDKLGRKDIVENLTKVIDSFDGSFVMSVDS
jgi:hypothetical protein